MYTFVFLVISTLIAKPAYCQINLKPPPTDEDNQNLPESSGHDDGISEFNTFPLLPPGLFKPPPPNPPKRRPTRSTSTSTAVTSSPESSSCTNHPTPPSINQETEENEDGATSKRVLGKNPFANLYYNMSQIKCSQVSACSPGTKNCSYLPWVSIQDATLSPDHTPSGKYTFPNKVLEQCYQKCQENSKIQNTCMGFSYRAGTGECRTYSTLRFAGIITDKGAQKGNLVVKIPQSLPILNEWLFLAEVRMFGSNQKTKSTPTQDWAECLKLCVARRREQQPRNCTLISYNPKTLQCHLFSGEELATKLEIYNDPEFVTLRHFSSLPTYQVSQWFTSLGKGIIRQVGNNSVSTSLAGRRLTLESREECLQICYQNGCKLVTIDSSMSGGTINCQTYTNLVLNNWVNNSSPQVATFYRTIPRNNSEFIEFLPNVQFNGVQLPSVSMINAKNVANCHQRCKKEPLCVRYSYNSDTKECHAFTHLTELLVKNKISRNNTRTTYYFQKALVQRSVIFLQFATIWRKELSPQLEFREIGNEIPQVSECLNKCLQNEACTGSAAQYNTAQNTFTCFHTTLKSLTKKLSTRTGTIKDGRYLFEIFIRKSNSHILTNPSKSSCSDKPMPLESLWSPGQLDLFTIRGTLPSGNNRPIDPHGAGFEGSPESRTPSPKSGIFEFDASPTNFEALDYSPREFIVTPIVVGTAIEMMPLLSKAAPIIVETAAPIVEAAAATGPLGWLALAGGAVALGTAIGLGYLLSSGKKKDEDISCSDFCGSKKRLAYPDLLLHDHNQTQHWFNLIRAISASDCVCPQPSKNQNINEDMIGVGGDDCSGKIAGQTCDLCCRAGYEARPNRMTCVCNKVKNKVEWNPDDYSCQGVRRCFVPGMAFEDRNLPIRVERCDGVLYYAVSHNGIRRIPNYSVYYRDGGPTNTKKREGDFQTFQCGQLFGFGDDYGQLDRNHYNRLNDGRDARRSGWAQGHYTPYADFKVDGFEPKATNYYINAAPQDANTNSGPWKTLETSVKQFFQRKSGTKDHFVVTGVCPGDNTTPDCYWKMVCSRADRGVTTVAAFYHRNILTELGNTAQKEARRAEVGQVRDQSFLTTLGIRLDQVWRESTQMLNNPLFISQCAAAPQLDIPLNPREAPRQRADESLGRKLFYFWYNGIIVEGWNKENNTVGEGPLTVGKLAPGQPPSCGKRVIGYVTSWSDVPLSYPATTYLTHILFAFIEITPDGSLRIGSADPGHSKSREVDIKKSYVRLYEIKNAKEQSNSRLKTMFAVGGWENSQYLSSIVGDSAATQRFIGTAIIILDEFNMDGVDIDFEYPVGGGATQGVAADRENYVTFLKKLRAGLESHRRSVGRTDPYLVSIAGAAGDWVLTPGYDLPGILSTVDWINVMTYDYFGAWDSKWGAYTGPIAPLFYGAPKGYSGKTNVDYTMKYYTCRSGLQGKLNVGLGFYGRYWNHSGSPVDPSNPLWRMAQAGASGGKVEGGSENWRKIKNTYLPNSAFTKAYDKKTETPYLLNSNGFLLAYENSVSLQAKVSYTATKGFGGIMIWALDLDDEDYTLTRTVTSSSLICGGGGSSAAAGYNCPPKIEGRRWWTPEDGDKNKEGLCGKAAPLYKGFYPVCDPEDPGYACCSRSGHCGSGKEYCSCEGCVDYFSNPDLILKEPVKPSGPIRWHTSDTFVPGPQCGYGGRRLSNGNVAICNPDDESGGYCCSNGGYCGKGKEFCECNGCINFKQDPNYVYPKIRWRTVDGKCGNNRDLSPSDNIEGKKPICNPSSQNAYCCSNSGYCGAGKEFCDCQGCVDFKKNPNYEYR